MLKSYTHLVTRYAKMVIAFVIVLSGIFGYYAQHLSIDASAETLLLEDDVDLKLTREVHGRYVSHDYLVIAFSPKEALLADRTLEAIKSLQHDLLKVEGVSKVTTLLDVPLLQSPPRPIKELMENIATLSSSTADKELVAKEFQTSPLYAKNLVSKDLKTTAMIIHLKDDERYNAFLEKRNGFLALQKERPLSAEELKVFEQTKKEFKAYRDSTRESTHTLINHVRETMAPYKAKGELFLGGVMMAADDMIGFVKNDIETYGAAVLAIMVAMLWIIFRQVRFVVLPIFISFIAVIITTGINALVGLEVTVISSNYVSMQLITTLSLVIHLIVCYREQYTLHPNSSKEELIAITLERMSIPSVFVILTSVAGFGSLMTCDIVPIIDLGTMMNIGVSVSLVSAYLLFPSIMVLLDKKEPVLTFDHHFTLNTRFAYMVEHHGKVIFGVVVVMALFSLYGASKLVVENSFINYFKKETEIYQGMKKIDSNLGGTTPFEIVLQFPKVEANTTPQTTTALDSFEAEFEASKDASQYWFTEQKMQTILKVHNYLKSLPEIGNVSSLGTLMEVGTIIKEGKPLDNFEWAVLYKELPQAYKEIILSPYVNIEHNEARFVVRVVDSNEALRRDELLQKVSRDLHETLGIEKENYQLVGMMVLYNNMLQSLFDSQISTLGLAVLSLGAMFLFLFRSLKVALLAMSVNMVPISIIFGVMGVFGIPLDMMSITIASIALGITVDNTIHYYYRFKEELHVDGDYIASMHRAHASIAFGMFYYSIATIVGFLVLVTSNFIPTLIFGLLTVLVLVVAIMSDLLFSPLLVVLFKPFTCKT